MIGDEPIAPYQRPPLSKAWLKGEADADSLALKPTEFYPANRIDFRPNVTALSLDRAAKTVSLSDGSSLSYDIAVIATGARAIQLPLPGADSPDTARLLVWLDPAGPPTALASGIATWLASTTSFFDTVGIASAIGEQPVKGLANPSAMARLAVAEHGHFGRAAEASGISQPTLSVLIKIATALGYEAAALVDMVHNDLIEADHAQTER